MAINGFNSTSFESLWRRFEGILALEPADTLAKEVVVVPASGWESYFVRRLAETRGCVAQYGFMTTGQWLLNTLREVLGPDKNPARDVETLTWAIATQLPDLLKGDSAFEAVRDYLEVDGGADTQRLVDLSRRIAGLFDQYSMCRPELIEAWDTDRDWPSSSEASAPQHAQWQRKLWRSVSENLSPQPVAVAAMVSALTEALNNGQGRLPDRLSVWLCGGVQPAVLDSLEAVGRHCNVFLYVLSPAQEYCRTMDISGEPSSQECDGDLPLREMDDPQLPSHSHPLLASMGTLSMERRDLLLDRTGEPWRFKTAPDLAPSAESESSTVLSRLRDDLRSGRTFAEESAPSNELEPDASLRVHSCHSPMREVEVLHDQIRDALEDIPDLQPEDVVVLCPDLQTYAPFVQAVFGQTVPGQAGHIPFNIAGRSPRQTRPLVQAFFSLLKVLSGRLAASEVLDLLASDSVGAAAGLDSNDQETLGQWVIDSGVRWAADAEHRLMEKLPESDLNTWQFGLDRLLLGYAMPPGGGQLVGETVAIDRAEGLQGEQLGRAWAFIDKLRLWREELSDSLPLEEWRQPLCSLAEDLLDGVQDEVGMQQILNAADDLAETARMGGFVTKVELSTVTRELLHLVDQTGMGRPFRLGGVTICDISAMRSLPFKVIALLGVNDGVFPRTDRPMGIDLMAVDSQPGDRSVRNEDKHLFLESLLAAENRLIITYQGQNVRDHRRRPASVIVEELLDLLSESGASEVDRKRLRDSLVVYHPLQPFSPRYFDGADERLGAYRDADRQVADALHGQELPPAFVNKSLPEEEPPITQLSVRRLRTLLEKPWELFLDRIGLRLPEDAEVVADREPFVLNHLEKWQICDPLLKGRLEGQAKEDLARRIVRSGQLPGGGLGEAALRRFQIDVDRIVRDATAIGVGVSAQSVHIHLPVDGMAVLGRVDDVTPQGIRRAMYSKHKTKYHLRLWLDHLLLAASGEANGSSQLVARDRVGKYLEFEPIKPDFALDRLTCFVRLFRAARRMPLPFFPDAVEVFTDKVSEDDEVLTLEDGLFAARVTFENPRSIPVMAEEPSIRTAFAGCDPFAMRCSQAPGFEGEGDRNLFAYLVDAIYRPMMDNLLYSRVQEVAK